MRSRRMCGAGGHGVRRRTWGAEEDLRRRRICGGGCGVQRRICGGGHGVQRRMWGAEEDLRSRRTWVADVLTFAGSSSGERSSRAVTRDGAPLPLDKPVVVPLPSDEPVVVLPAVGPVGVGSLSHACERERGITDGSPSITTKTFPALTMDPPPLFLVVRCSTRTGGVTPDPPYEIARQSKHQGASGRGGSLVEVTKSLTSASMTISGEAESVARSAASGAGRSGQVGGSDI